MSSHTPGGRGRATALRAHAVGLFDQALVSAVGFIAAVVVARSAGADEFGEFVLAYTTLLVVTSLQAALVTQPHNVLGARRAGDAYVRYTSTMAAVQVGFATGTTAIALLASAVLAVVVPDHAAIVLALAAANVGWQLLEFVRRVLYTEGRAAAALAADAVGWGGYLCALGGLAGTGRLSSATATAALGVTTALGSMLGGAAIRASLARTLDWGTLRESWNFGRWLAAARVTFWAASHLYTYLAAVIVGAVAAAALRAGQILLGPLNVFLLFLDLVLPIRLSQRHADGGARAAAAALRRTYAWTVIPVAAYCATVALLAEPLLRLVFGDGFAQYSVVVVLLAVYYFVQYLVQGFVAALNARGRTKQLFYANAGAAVSGLVLGWPLITALAEDGAALGMALSAVVLLVFVWLAHRSSADEHQLPAAPEPIRTPVAGTGVAALERAEP